MKLSTYADHFGITRQTATRWFHAGKIKGAYQLDTGTIIVPNDIFDKETQAKGRTIVYARVSSSEQRKTTLETQAKRLVDFSIANGWVVDEVIKEVGSGLNDERPKLMGLLKSDEPIRRLVVEHKDRLTRFGFNYLMLLAEKMNFEIIVVNNAETNREDLIQDFIAIITSFCAKIYPRRHVKQKTKHIIEELTHAASGETPNKDKS